MESIGNAVCAKNESRMNLGTPSKKAGVEGTDKGVDPGSHEECDVGRKTDEKIL